MTIYPDYHGLKAFSLIDDLHFVLVALKISDTRPSYSRILAQVHVSDSPTVDGEDKDTLTGAMADSVT